MNPLRSVWLSAAWPEIEILYEDADAIVFNKPAGLIVVPDRWDKARENFMGLLQDAIARKRPWITRAQIDYLANVHRLDKDTSGVFLVAKNKPALTKLCQQFEDGATEKLYIALCRGAPVDSRTTIDLPIGPHPRERGLSSIRRDGKQSRSEVEVLERFRRHALLQVRILTGRQHQVRVHLQAIGCPLVGDEDYGDGEPLLLSQLKPKYKAGSREEAPLIARPALHADRLTFTQPSTDEPITVIAPWPKDLTIAVKYLRRFAAA